MKAPSDRAAQDPRPKPNARCPVCGGPNGCAPAACGSFDVDCWCSSAVIGPAALGRVPEALRGEACLCPRCAGVPPRR
ncbi:MAG: cysteine-rich CWC family protein [Gammaproteobacteria bacterium]